MTSYSKYPFQKTKTNQPAQLGFFNSENKQSYLSTKSA